MNLRLSLFVWFFLATTTTRFSHADTKKPIAPPNILFAIADDWGLHAGAYGTKWVKTPHFDRVAREGLLFDRMFTPIAKCAPSRAAIVTGRNPWQLKAAANHVCFFPAEFKSWCEELTDQGWFVGHTVKGWGPGIALDNAGKARQMTGKAFNGHTSPTLTKGIHGADYAANFNDFLQAAPADKPWCFWYGCLEPHRDYEFGSGVKKGGKQLADIDRVPGYWPDNETVRNDMLDYALEVEHFDTHLGRMLAELERRGQLENTLVVVTSDHGMPFPRVKGHTYEFANHVPFAVRWPQGIVEPGRKVTDYASFVDLAPTFLEVAGLTAEKTGMPRMTGQSLTPIFRNQKTEERDYVLIGKERTDIGRPNDAGYPTRGIIRDNWLYLKNFEPSRWPGGNPETGYTDSDAGATKTHILAAHRKDADDAFWKICFGKRPAEELYDLTADPDCLKNLAADANAAAKRDSLAKLMETKLTAQEDPRILGQGDVFDKYPYANKGHANFYERWQRGEKVNAGWIDTTDIDTVPTGK